MSHVKIYPFGSAISFHGKISIPITPVIYPPIRKLILAGDRLAKSLAGLTILAAILVARVEMATAIMAKLTIHLFSNLLANTKGSHIVEPKTMAVAEVTTTPIKAKSVMEGGKPMACPITWARCEVA